MCNQGTPHPFPQNTEEILKYVFLYFVIFVYGLLLHLIRFEVEHKLDSSNRRDNFENESSVDSDTSDTSLDDLSDDSEDSYSSGYFSNDDNYV